MITKSMLKSDLNNAYIIVGKQSREIERQADVIKELEERCNTLDKSLVTSTKEIEKELREKILNEKCSTCRYNTVGQDEYITILEEQNKELEAQIEKMQEKLKADLIARLKEQMQYSTSPSCTKGMELFIRSIEEWEIKENG